MVDGMIVGGRERDGRRNAGKRLVTTKVDSTIMSNKRKLTTGSHEN
jgi:hypothetical protein